MESMQKSATLVSSSMARLYSGKHLSDPKLIAEVIRNAVTVKRPKTRYLVGFMAKPMVYFKNIFGDKAYDRLVGMINKGDSKERRKS